VNVLCMVDVQEAHRGALALAHFLRAQWRQVYWGE